MIKFFRHIRQNLLMENKKNRYLKYAIGEVLLVVIGILLALQINNWNENRVLSNKLHNYYVNFDKVLGYELKNVKQFSAIVDTLVIKNKRSLELLALNDKDSLSKLKKTLGALGTSYSAGFHIPILEEFLDQDYLTKIKSDSLKMYMTAFVQVYNDNKSFDTYLDNQYRVTIEPYFNKHINYALVAEKKHREGLVQGGPPIDYISFANDLELWNIITFKLETLNSQLGYLKGYSFVLEGLQRQLKKELD